MKRKVEIYCFKETYTEREEKGWFKKRTVKEYKYTSCWLDAAEVQDSRQFKDKRFDLNKYPSMLS